jgi:preprotein translocase subunit SecG
MGFLIPLLTVVLVLDCVVLMFLVLIQLPKKEAGAGLAFGGAATDALFGAGSGNVLTKITKYAATIFFVLAVILSVMQRNFHTSHVSAFAAVLTNAAAMPTLPPGTTRAPGTPSTAPETPAPKLPAASGSNAMQVAPPVEATNLAIPLPATPAAPAPPKK